MEFPARTGSEPPDTPHPNLAAATREAQADLQKPIWQLVCDVHEECLNHARNADANTIHAIKRMSSLMGRVAVEHEENHSRLVKLTEQLRFWTIMLAGLTAVLIAFTIVLAFKKT
jgi:hypothetical protein